MIIEYRPGLRVKLIGEFGATPATVKKVAEKYIVIQFDELDSPTTILNEQVRKLEDANEIELENNVDKENL